MTMDLNAIQAEIRAEADIVRRQLANPPDSSASSIPPVTPLLPVHYAGLDFASRPEPLADGSYRVWDLLVFEDEKFVDVAYRVLLRHAPDREGLAFYTRMLRAGKTKAEVLARLRYSHEGRTQAVRLRGLVCIAGAAALTYVPVIRQIASWLYELVLLPRTLRRLRRNQELMRRHTGETLARLSARINEQSRAINAMNQSHQVDAGS